jgi:protease-4
LRPSLLAIALLCPSAAALAQAPTAGIFVPDGDVAAGVGAQMLEVNPAGIGFGGGFDLAYSYIDAAAASGGQGHQIALSVGLDMLHLGIGTQFLEAPAGLGEGSSKATFAVALEVSESFSVGAAWHRFISDSDSALNDTQTWDVGVQARPSRWVALGARLSDVSTPVIGETQVELGYDAAISVRPGTEDLSLTATARLYDAKATFGGLLSWRFFGPFALQGRYERADLGDAAVHRVMLGVSGLGQIALGLFGFSPDLGGEGRAGFGVTARLRSSVPAMPSVLARPRVVEVGISSGDEYTTVGFFSRSARTPFLETLLTLRRLAAHDEVAGILLTINADLGWAQAAEVREAIKMLRRAGKKVYAYLPVGDTRTYSIAAAADAIYTAPAGGLLLTGLRIEMMYLADLLGALGVKAQFVAIGAFKSAPETFTNSGPSPAARMAEDALLDSLYGQIVGHIAEGRGLPVEEVRRLIDQGPYTAKSAQDAGLVDGVIHYDEFESVAREAFGGRVSFVDPAYLLAGSDRRWGEQDGIGLLFATGTITDGKSVQNPLTGSASTGADSFVRAARRMRLDASIAAVVLRIDSPGGSVTASDAMWRELTRLADVKPLIVSMGDVAASGGYYVAAAADEILAMPETVTGSIGIFSGKFDLSEALGKIGVNRVIMQRGKRAALLSSSRPWGPEEKTLIRESMQTLYDLFLDRVAAGRPNLSRADIEPLAQGRVWTGAQARGCGLVDRPAGFLTAIDLAAQQAGLGHDEYRLVPQSPESGFGGLPRFPVLATVLAWIGISAPAPAIMQQLLPWADQPALHFISGTPLALLPFTFED